MLRRENDECAGPEVQVFRPGQVFIERYSALAAKAAARAYL